MKISVTVTDNSGELLAALKRQSDAVLRQIAERAKKYAQQNISSAGLRKSGELLGSIDTAVRNHTAYIGTDNEYAPHHELGTGHYNTKHASERYGVPAQHFLKYAVSKHVDEYKKMILEAMKR